MLIDLLEELIAAIIAGLVVAAGTFLWRLLRQVPFVMVGIGTALLVVAIGLGFALAGENLRTDGSLLGLVILVVFGSAVVLGTLLGFTFAYRGFADAADGSSTQMAAALGTMVVVAISGAGLWTKRLGGFERGGGREAAAEVPDRKYPPLAERSSQRSVEVNDAYALAWKARGDAAPLQMRIPASRFVPAATRIAETADGPRHLDLLAIEAPATAARLRLHRDDSELEDAVHAALFGRARKRAIHDAVWVDDSDGAWKLVGFDCTSPDWESLADAMPEGGPGCYVPQGRLARWFPSMSGPKRLRVDVRSARSTCRMTFLYRGRPMMVTSPVACAEPASLAALVAAVRLAGRLEKGVRAPPLAAERLAAALDAVVACERSRELKVDAQTRSDTCRLGFDLASAERDASPAEADALLVRLSEVARLPKR